MAFNSISADSGITKERDFMNYSWRGAAGLMKPATTMCAVAAFTLALLPGCASNPGVVQLSPDTYLISKTDKAGILGNASAMKAKAINEANEFARSKGKVLIPISTHESPLGIGRLASFDYQFKLVDADSLEARATPLIQRADVVVQKDEKSTVQVETKDASSKQPDMYAQLIKLDDLHKRGILTDAEFEAAKAKVLAGSASP